MKAKTILTTFFVMASVAAWAAAEVGFKAAPTVSKAGGKVTIKFEAAAATDAEVSILDAGGKVVRHLAAGRLGEKPPKPFKRGLAQKIFWDGKDDDGKPVEDVGACKVRVGLGLRPKFDNIIGWSGNQLASVNGLVAGADGTLYVIHSARLYAHRQTWLITAYDGSGKYLRQVFPGPANLPAAKRKGWPRIKMPDGAEIPVISHLLPRTTYPGAVFDNRMFPVMTKDGRIVVLSGCGYTTIKHPDIRGGRRLLILGSDGSVPADFLGPVICPQIGGFGHIALSPDNKYVYATGFVSTGKRGKGPSNVVYRAALDGSETSKVYIGQMYGSGAAPAGLSDPQGIDVDAAGNLYVADYGNDRVAVFKPDGSYLDEIKTPHPDVVRVSRKTGAIYVTELRKRPKPFTDGHYYVPAHNWKLERVHKFANLTAKTARAVFANPFSAKQKYGGGAHLALDESGDKRVLWLDGLKYLGGPVLKVIDEGDKFVRAGAPIDDRFNADKAKYVGFAGDVAVLGGKVFSRFPALGAHTPTSYTYSAETGEYLGEYTPKRADGKTKANMWTLLYGEAHAGGDGYMYYHAGNHMIRKYDLAGKEAPYVGTGTNTIGGFWHGHTRGAGLFVDRDGTIYIPAAKANRKLEDMKVKVVCRAGEIVNDNLIHVQGARMGGIAVDPGGNVYIGAQAVPKDQRIPKRFAGKLPPDSAAHHPSLDYKQHAMIFKFPPAGGRIVKDPKGDFVGHCQYGSTSLRVEGALWTKRIGYIGSHGRELGCHCETTRFDVDGYGRLFAPDPFRFSVSVFDGAGNEITRFGSYGNMDSRGSGSPVPVPAIPLGWPLSVECAGGRVFIADVVNRRIVAVKFEHAASAECAVP